VEVQSDQARQLRCIITNSGRLSFQQQKSW